MIVDKSTRDLLLEIYKTKRLSLEGNIIKVISSEPGDAEFEEYLKESLERDQTSRRKRLEISKEIQSKNHELLKREEEITRINSELTQALQLAERVKAEALKAKDEALNDLDVLQKRKQNEMVSLIVKVSLSIVGAVGIITTGMYALAIVWGKDTQIIGSTWSNMFGILLTNAFSIVGTIMGVKYASKDSAPA